MSIEVTVTVRIVDTTQREITICENRFPSGDNPHFFDALTAEKSIVEAGRAVVKQIVVLRGDVRDTAPSTLSDRDLIRVLT